MKLVELRALFIGRFQPFHSGHFESVKEISKKFDEVVIVIGSSQHSNEKRNPFTEKERTEMIRATLKENFNYRIVPVTDIDCHEKWVEHVEEFVPPFDCVFSNNDLARRLFSEAGCKVSNTTVVEFDGKPISGERIRETIAKDDRSWVKMVPKEVHEKILEMDGVKRVEKLFEK